MFLKGIWGIWASSSAGLMCKSTRGIIPCMCELDEGVILHCGKNISFHLDFMQSGWTDQSIPEDAVNK